MDTATSAQSGPRRQKWQQFLEEAQYRWHLDATELNDVDSIRALSDLLVKKFGLAPKRAENEVARLAELFARRVQRAA
jgi:hypothetical protein